MSWILETCCSIRQSQIFFSWLKFTKSIQDTTLCDLGDFYRDKENKKKQRESAVHEIENLGNNNSNKKRNKNGFLSIICRLITFFLKQLTMYWKNVKQSRKKEKKNSQTTKKTVTEKMWNNRSKDNKQRNSFMKFPSMQFIDIEIFYYLTSLDGFRSVMLY